MTLTEAREMPFEGDIGPYDESLPGITIAGVDGKMDAKSMHLRFVKAKKLLDSIEYREVVPCEHCKRCLVFRQFDKKGQLKTVGLYCTFMKTMVKRWGTCRFGDEVKNRKNVIVDMTNAPKGIAKTDAEAIAAMEAAEAEAMKEQAAMLDELMKSGYKHGYGGKLRRAKEAGMPETMVAEHELPPRYRRKGEKESSCKDTEEGDGV